MAQVPIQMPQLGESIAEATIVRILVKEGDTVQADADIIEVETNKAVMGDRSIASSKSGVHGEVAAGEVVSGYPAIPNRLWLRCSAAFSKLPEMARTLRQLQR